jgi:hypothetical protein
MIGLVADVKCEKPLFVQLIYRYFYNPLVVGMQLTHLSYESNSYSISNRGELLQNNKEYYY